MARTFTNDMAKSMLPQRPVKAHKGTFGHLYVIAGSRGFTGATKLTCEAAGRAGVGLVTAGVPRPLGDVVAGALLEAMSMLLPATAEDSLSREAVGPALEFAADKEAVVLGPGLSQHSDTIEFVREFVPKCPVPLLIDADGLNALAGALEVLDGREEPTVLTPHPGEMARLAGMKTEDVQGARESVAVQFAKDHGLTLVLKGSGTLVAEADGTCHINATGNSGMATGGTGDVLSGVIGSLMAQGAPPRDAALLGTYVHGLAGDLAAESLTERALVAGDVISYLPHAWRYIDEGKP